MWPCPSLHKAWSGACPTPCQIIPFLFCAPSSLHPQVVSMTTRYLPLLGFSCLLLVGCADDENATGSGGNTTTWSGSGGQGGTGGAGTAGEGGMTASGGAGQGGSGSGAGGSNPGDCIPAEGAGSAGTDNWMDDAYTATVSMDAAGTCTRSYTMTTDAPLRDNQPSNPRTFAEQSDWPVLRSNSNMLDAL